MVTVSIDRRRALLRRLTPAVLAGLGVALPLVFYRAAPRWEAWFLPRHTPWWVYALGAIATATAAAAAAVSSRRTLRWTPTDDLAWVAALASLAILSALGAAPVPVGLVLYGLGMLFLALRMPRKRTMLLAGVTALGGTLVRAAAQPSLAAVLPYVMVVVLMLVAHGLLAVTAHQLAWVLSEREALLNDRRERGPRHRERNSTPGLGLSSGSVRSLRGATPVATASDRESASDDIGWEGLVDRLRASITTLCDDAGVSSTVHAEVKGLAPPSSKMRQGVIKVTQEAASHALREAEARRIAVTLRRADGGLVLEVEDDGTGSEGGRSRKALAAIRGRVASLGGSAEVKRAAAGWVMRVKLPCEQLN